MTEWLYSSSLTGLALRKKRAGRAVPLVTRTAPNRKGQLFLYERAAPVFLAGSAAVGQAR